MNRITTWQQLKEIINKLDKEQLDSEVRLYDYRTESTWDIGFNITGMSESIEDTLGGKHVGEDMPCFSY